MKKMIVLLFLVSLCIVFGGMKLVIRFNERPANFLSITIHTVDRGDEGLLDHEGDWCVSEPPHRITGWYSAWLLGDIWSYYVHDQAHPNIYWPAYADQDFTEGALVPYTVPYKLVGVKMLVRRSGVNLNGTRLLIKG